jgi:hypothetical protein
MALWCDEHLASYQDHDTYTGADGTTYPAQYPKGEISELRPVAEVPPPDDAPSGRTVDGQPRGGVIVTGWHVERVGGVPTQVWDTAVRPDMTPDEVVAAAVSVCKADAQTALHKSDVTVLRCVETGVALPETWAAYRQMLRAIISGGPGPIPARPDYPEGT